MSSTTTTLVRGARLARRVPGYRALRRSVVPRLRRNKTLRGAAQVIWPTTKKDRSRPLPSGVTAGDLLHGIGTQELTRLGIVALGCSEDVLAGVVEEVAREQLLSATFAPVFLLDQPHFALTRRYGFVTELLPPPDTDPDRRQALLADRITGIQRAYGITEWLRIGPRGLDDLDRSLLQLAR